MLNCLLFSGCNRTYYGNLGITYDLELHRPKEDKIPYVCELNFTAAGGLHGDIIQVLYKLYTYMYICSGAYLCTYNGTTYI